jgi:hypothetical protein
MSVWLQLPAPRHLARVRLAQAPQRGPDSLLRGDPDADVPRVLGERYRVKVTEDGSVGGAVAADMKTPGRFGRTARILHP